jgi:hypothetical protein
MRIYLWAPDKKATIKKRLEGDYQDLRICLYSTLQKRCELVNKSCGFRYFFEEKATFFEMHCFLATIPLACLMERL